MQNRRSDARRILLTVLGLLAIAGVLAGAALLLGIGDRATVNVTSVADSATADATPGSGDPLAWDAAKRGQFEQRAALGLSHVLYEKSPGGIVASAKRTAHWRPLIEAAAKRHGVDPDVLEAIVLLESAGRPDAMAAPTPDTAVGLAQILPSTATDLLGMKVDLASSIALTKQIDQAAQINRQAEDEEQGRGRARAQADPEAESAATRVDQRYQPRALRSRGQRISTDRRRVLRRPATRGRQLPHGNRQPRQRDRRLHRSRRLVRDDRKLVDAEGLSYAQIFFDTSPTRNVKAWKLLASFGDDSSTYLWRVLSAEQAMKLYRSSPDRSRP